MDAFGEWMGNLAFYMVMVTAAMQVLPESDYRKYIRFFTGMVLVILLLTPALQLLGMEKNLTEPSKSREYQTQVEKIRQASEILWEIAPEEEQEEKAGIDVEEIAIGP